MLPVVLKRSVFPEWKMSCFSKTSDIIMLVEWAWRIIRIVSQAELLSVHFMINWIFENWNKAICDHCSPDLDFDSLVAWTGYFLACCGLWLHVLLLLLIISTRYVKKMFPFHENCSCMFVRNPVYTPLERDLYICVQKAKCFIRQC